MLPRMPNSEKTQANSSKSGVFIRRSLSTLGLWIGVAGAFVARQAWAYSLVVGAFAILASAEYFQMLRKAGVRGHAWFGYWFRAYSLALAWYLSAAGGWSPGRGLMRQGVFALAGRCAGNEATIRGVDAMSAVAGNVFGFVYVAYCSIFPNALSFWCREAGGGRRTGIVVAGGGDQIPDMGACYRRQLIGRGTR